MRKYESILAISHHTHAKALAGAFVFFSDLAYHFERSVLAEGILYVLCKQRRSLLKCFIAWLPCCCRNTKNT